MAKRILLTVALALVVAGPAGARPAAAPLQGVVVGLHQGVVLVAASGGNVTAVAGRAALGTRVRLVNGRLVSAGHARHASVKGVVVRRTAHATYLSAARHVLVVRSAPRTAASPADPGSVVQARVEIEDDGVLRERDEHAVGDAAKVEIEGVVTAVGAGTVTVTVGGQSLTIPLPAGVSVPASFVGRMFELELKFPATAAGGVLVTSAVPATIPAAGARSGDDGRRGHGGGGDDGGHGGGDH